MLEIALQENRKGTEEQKPRFHQRRNDSYPVIFVRMHAMYTSREPNQTRSFAISPRITHGRHTARISARFFQRVYLPEKNSLGAAASRDIKCTLRIYDDEE